MGTKQYSGFDLGSEKLEPEKKLEPGSIHANVQLPNQSLLRMFADGAQWLLRWSITVCISAYMHVYQPLREFRVVS